ncbi:MAG: GNAT family N-acetyltransferase [Verrucomicrobia bacterium]|nr:GNAT family N-acetyltransferase [Verrucomicrobiota bacterium]MCF7707466.1 GNAT family N-acetyltransferase [Verrucomicrobiota bacterium]
MNDGNNVSGGDCCCGGSGKEDLEIVKIRDESEWPSEHPRDEVESLLYEWLKPYNDTPPAIHKAVDYALGKDGKPGGGVLIGKVAGRYVGFVVVNKTGMGGYIPDNILVYIAVAPEQRGKGLGGRLIEATLNEFPGDFKLHVEQENPARRLYRKVGFTEKYAEMRFQR